MSEPTESDHNDEHPEITSLLREPVPVDPVRRDAAIDAALELSSTLYPADATGRTTSGDPTATPSGPDELAARRHVAPVPAPRHGAARSTGRRGLLVAAAVVVIAGIGIAGLAANRGNGGLLASGSSEDSAEMETAESAPAADDGAGGGAADATSSPAPSDAAGSHAEADAAPSTTVGSGQSLAQEDEGFAGTFASVDELLDALTPSSAFRSTSPSSDAVLITEDCLDEFTRLGLTPTGRAVVGSLPVWLARPADDPAVLVVLDGSSCAELGRR